MSKIDDLFFKLAERGEGALVTYIMAGDPDIEKTIDYALAVVDGGADIIELGLPFSDPVADGPAIQKAELRALNGETTWKTVLEIAEEINDETDIPIILMSYFNPIYQAGRADFLNKARNAGVDGLIIPDLPVEETGGYIQEARRVDLDTIFLVTPETDNDRFGSICEASTGFLYLVARYGTTGAKKILGEEVQNLIERAVPELPNDLPLAVGFGLSQREHIEKVISSGANAAIVGSAIVEKIERGIEPAELARFVEELKAGTRTC